MELNGSISDEVHGDMHKAQENIFDWLRRWWIEKGQKYKSLARL